MDIRKLVEMELKKILKEEGAQAETALPLTYDKCKGDPLCNIGVRINEVVGKGPALKMFLQILVGAKRTREFDFAKDKKGVYLADNTTFQEILISSLKEMGGRIGGPDQLGKINVQLQQIYGIPIENFLNKASGMSSEELARALIPDVTEYQPQPTTPEPRKDSLTLQGKKFKSVGCKNVGPVQQAAIASLESIKQRFELENTPAAKTEQQKIELLQRRLSDGKMGNTTMQLMIKLSDGAMNPNEYPLNNPQSYSKACSVDNAVVSKVLANLKDPAKTAAALGIKMQQQVAESKLIRKMIIQEVYKTLKK
jgi:hypothetical protein